jgi:ComF family protein
MKHTAKTSFVQSCLKTFPEMSCLGDFVTLIFPDTCRACHSPLIHGEKVICTSCGYYLPLSDSHLNAENPVSKLFWGRVELSSAAAYYSFQKGGYVQQLIHQLKYKGRREVAIEIGMRFGAELKKADLFRTAELIIPVPLHVRKLKKRGFNQSDLFAQGLSACMDIPTDTESLVQETATETQTRKSRFSRWKNVESKFFLRDNKGLKGKHILLVDDVVTTGATLEACAKILLEVEGTKVSVAAMAIAGI